MSERKMWEEKVTHCLMQEDSMIRKIVKENDARTEN